MGQDILTRRAPPSTHRIPYEADPLQFGDLWLPNLGSHQLAPVVMMIHGGWWQSAYDLAYCGFLCDALKALGIAVWSIEYRRVGDPGGGWPGTMQDAASAFDHLAALASVYPLDLTRIVVAGHSAGGQLAFWLAGRHHIPPSSVLHNPQPKLSIHGLVGLAGAIDFRLLIELGGTFRYSNCKPATESLMGGPPSQWPDRYAAANPGDLLPLNIPQVLVQGSEDDQIPATLPSKWAALAHRQGDPVEVRIISGADHFDVVDPHSKAWPGVRSAFTGLLGMPSK